MSINPSQTPGYIPPAGPPPGVPPPVAPPPERTGGGFKIPLLFGCIIALIGANVYMYMQVDRVRKDLAKVNDSLQSEVERVKETSAVSNQTHHKTVEALRAQLEVERRQARMAAGEAKSEALKKVAETETKLQAAQEKSQAQLTSQISDARQSADTKIGEVGTEVKSVKSDVASTRSDLEKTIADLKRTNGDLNGQGVLIATNGKELAALRALGERNYVEFNIRKTKDPQKVGDVMIQLKKADPKKNRYTIELSADDKKVEKKDRTVNEPLQFVIASRTRQPYEIVVNDVKKDQIAGYLSIPKVQTVRN
jgi:hypothetical protein